jgi:hypothetical protein
VHSRQAPQWELGEEEQWITGRRYRNMEACWTWKQQQQIVQAGETAPQVA